MKTQLKFQKILALVTLIVAAIAFIFSICFFSGNLSDVMVFRMAGKRSSYIGNLVVNGETVVVEAVLADYFTQPNDWILSAQSTMDTLVTLCIIFFVVIAFVYILGLNSRRNYYITNYIMTGVLVAYGVFLAIFGIVSMIVLMSGFMDLTLSYPGDLGFQVLQNQFNFSEISKSPVIFILGIIAYLLVLLVALVWVYNLIWKIKLMKGEKELLSKGYVKEVA